MTAQLSIFGDSPAELHPRPGAARRPTQAGGVATPWTCHAQPAPHGRRCGHVNRAGLRYDGRVCCEECGCTRAASEYRRQA